MLPKSSTPLMLAENIKDSTVLATSIYLKGNISNIFHLWSSSYSLCVAQAAVGGRARKPFYCKSSREAASEIQLVFLHKFCKKNHLVQNFKGNCRWQQEVLFPQFPARGEVHTKVPISLSGLWGVVHLPNDQGSIAALKWRRRRGSQPTSSNDKRLIGAVKAAGRGLGGEGCGGVRAGWSVKVCVPKCPPPCSNDQHSIGAVKCLGEKV